jgi:hypothetical protein
MTEQKALGLLTLLVTDSQLSRDLTATLNQPAQTPDGVWSFFTAAVAPFGITGGDIDRAKLEPLWMEEGVLQPQFDSSHESVGGALQPPLVYDPGPCPNGVLENDFMSKLS